MTLRLPRPWISQEQRDVDRFEDGRQDAFARGMRQAAARARLAPGSAWEPVPVQRRQIRQQVRLAQQRAHPAEDTGRAETLARAMEQATDRDRARTARRRSR